MMLRTKRPAFQFYPRDWLGDTALRTCSVAARGLWIDMLSFMHEGEPYGYLRLNGKPVTPEALARMVGDAPATVKRLLVELTEAGVCSTDDDGAIYSRRMVRDEHNRNVRAAGGYASLDNPNVPQPKDGRKDRAKDNGKDRQKDHHKDSPQASLSGSFGGSPASASASASAVASASKSGAEADVSSRPAESAAVSGSNGAAPPAPPADAKAAEDQQQRAPQHRVAAGGMLDGVPESWALLGRVPDPKFHDARLQLEATLTSQGARLAKGEYVRAYSVAHLAHCCRLVLDSPPDKPEQLARWVLLKLRDTFAEWRSRDEKHAAEKIAPEIAAVIQPAQKIDPLEAARDWLADRPDVKREIEAAAEQKFAGFPKNPAMLRRHGEWLDQELVRRWTEAGSPITEPDGAARVGSAT